MSASLAAAPGAELPPWIALQHGLRTVFTAIAPVAGAAFVLALVSSFAQVGPMLALRPLRPELARLDPVKNARNLLGKRALFELAKSLVKITGAAYLAWGAVADRLPRLLSLSGMDPALGLVTVTECLAAIAVRVALLMAVLAAVDLLYQRHAHYKRLMMTRTEVQREQKESEGDPQRKAERQRIHREISEHQMLESVAKADCVVVNPDHVAVALRYEAEAMDAPRVVARGRRIMAQKIKEIAKQHGVPIVRNVPLARALVELELDDEIPAELYEAVAEVLRFVYRLSEGRRER
jgi:flagellar biosynthetic protein FlhB